MKKVVGAFFLVLVAVATFFGYQYYQDTYVGSTYYTVVPAGIEKQDIHSMGGELMGQGYKYKLTAFNDKGESKEIEFSIITDGDYRQGDAYQVGTYLKVTASKKRVIQQEVVEKDQVPAKVLEHLS